MLIMAISFGALSDPYVCSDETLAVFENPKDALAFICGQKKIPEETVDEIFIIKNDEIVKHFTAEQWTDFNDTEAEDENG